MRLVVALAILAGAGCRQVFGLEDPAHLENDAHPSDAHPGDAQPTDAPVVRPDGTDGGNLCPSGYVAVSGQAHRYKVIASAVSWNGQGAACSGTSGSAYLMVPDSASELTAVNAFASENAYWIGISEVGGSFIDAHTNLPATFLPWAPGQPNTAGNAHCVEANGSGAIFLASCPTSFPAVCECEP